MALDNGGTNLTIHPLEPFVAKLGYKPYRKMFNKKGTICLLYYQSFMRCISRHCSLHSVLYMFFEKKNVC